MQNSSVKFLSGLCVCLLIFLVITCTPGNKKQTNPEQIEDQTTEKENTEDTGIAENPPEKEYTRIDLRERTEKPPLDDVETYIEWMKEKNQ